MTGLDFHRLHGRAWTFAEMLAEQTDLGELDGLMLAREGLGKTLNPALAPTTAERAAYATRRAELAKAAALRATR